MFYSQILNSTLNKSHYKPSHDHEIHLCTIGHHTLAHPPHNTTFLHHSSYYLSSCPDSNLRLCNRMFLIHFFCHCRYSLSIFHRFSKSDRKIILLLISFILRKTINQKELIQELLNY